MAPDVELLPWDTRFFGFSVGRVHVPVCDEIALKAIVQKARQLGVRLLYVFDDSSADLSQKLINIYSGCLVDTKRTYWCALEQAEPSSGFESIQEFSPEQPVAQLYELAYQSGEQSRFKRDAAIGDENFKRLYRQWVDNSLSGKAADAVFVYVADESIGGFITVQKKETVATIGLMATDKAVRGRGIGSAMLNYVKQDLRLTPAIRLEVATQKKNTTACRFYERNGFVLGKEVNVYHLWL